MRYTAPMRRLLSLSLFCLTLAACSPSSSFNKTTGLTVPNDAKLILEGDTDSGDIRGGETYMAFQVSPETIQGWMNGEAPWGQTWRQGPVEADIGGRTSFGSTNAGYDANDKGQYVFSHDSAVIKEVLSSKGTLYVARRRGDDELPLNSGDLLLLDLAKNQVWLSSWDF